MNTAEKGKRKFHYRNLATALQLQRVYRLLADGRERSTREINRGADIESCSTVVSELNHNGCQIDCRRRGDYWFYRMAYGSPWPDFPDGIVLDGA